MKPEEANARFVLRKLSSAAMVDLANSWLRDGIYSESLGGLCTIREPIMSEVGPIFSSAMRELEMPTPTRMEAAGTVIAFALKRIYEGCPNPLEEAESLYWEVYHELDGEFPNKAHVGDNLGLEHVFCWLREIWDCRDGSMILYYSDLPREAAEVKFFEHLREAAANWLRDNGEPAAGVDGA